MKKLIDLIGNTPLIEYENIDSNTLYLKLEKFNLAGSIKDRAVLGMIEDAQSKGIIKPGMTLVEATSGNTGIALAMIGAIKGYEVIICMPESMSIERRQAMSAYGAKLVLTDKVLGMNGAVAKMEELLRENPQYASLKQFDNPANPQMHYETTAEEIIKDCPQITALVAGVGTGGTISGVGKRLKEFNPNIKIIAVEPASSQILKGDVAGPHGIQGIGANFIPNNYDSKVVDEIIAVSTEETYTMTAKLAKTGVAVGISSGAAYAGALKYIDSKQNEHVVIIQPDGLEKYYSTGVIHE